MTDRDFINMIIDSYLSYAIDPHMATLNNTVANRLNDIANKLDSTAKYRELEKELGCPLDVVFKAIKQGYVWTKDGTTNRTELKYDQKVNDFYWNLNFDCYFKNYMKTWWLIQDRSE